MRRYSWPVQRIQNVYTFVKTPTFVAEADKVWKEGERLEFFEWLASNPEVGDVIPGSGGRRKVRWSRAGVRETPRLSQTQFAEALGISKRTLQKWEQGRCSPSGAAQALIRIAAPHPAVIREVLA